MPRLTVGLTGGVASGKSLVSARFQDLGVPLLDADQVSREVVAPPSPALDEIARRFGREYLTEQGELDRRRMRERIFQDISAKRQLEAILHPHMWRRMAEWRDAQQAPYCILSAAILLEAGMKSLVDRVLVVDTPVEVQLTRLLQRDGIGAELARDMIAAQHPREIRLAAADDVIVNSGSPEEACRQVDQLHRRYLQLAAPE